MRKGTFWPYHLELPIRLERVIVERLENKAPLQPLKAIGLCRRSLLDKSVIKFSGHFMLCPLMRIAGK